MGQDPVLTRRARRWAVLKAEAWAEGTCLGRWEEGVVNGEKGGTRRRAGLEEAGRWLLGDGPHPSVRGVQIDGQQIAHTLLPSIFARFPAINYVPPLSHFIRSPLFTLLQPPRRARSLSLLRAAAAGAPVCAWEHLPDWEPHRTALAGVRGPRRKLAFSTLGFTWRPPSRSASGLVCYGCFVADEIQQGTLDAHPIDG